MDHHRVQPRGTKGAARPAIRLSPHIFARRSAVAAIATIAIVAWSLAAPAAPGDCTEWGLSKSFDVIQGNGFTVHFSLTETGPSLRGTASYSGANGAAEGSIDAGQVELTVIWNNGTRGRYVGTIRPTYHDGFATEGSLKGYTIDLTHGGPKVGWHARDSASATVSNPDIVTCVALVPMPSPNPPAPPAGPLDNAGVVETPGTGIGAILKETKPAPQQPQGFAGIWDTTMGDGLGYTLTLDAQGNGSIGAVDPRMDGTLQGGLSSDGKQLSFVMSQPNAGIVSRGELALSADAQSFAGRITKDTEGVPRSWTGTRRP